MTSTVQTQPELELDEFSRAEAAAAHVRARIAGSAALAPQIAIVLGSGLGDFADSLTNAVIIPYEEIPHFPRSTAIGHAGRMVIGKLGEVTVLAMQGRVHQYEGYSAKQAAFPARVFARLGLKTIILTNAAGGINGAYGQGALVILSDHINLQGTNPLTGPNDERFGPRFSDMTEAYSHRLRELTKAAAREQGIEIFEGVYAALAGPSYETPAEIRYLRTIGADLVGMSTVPEVIAARHSGIEVLAISCVTNMAAGITGEIINHQEVLETGLRVRGKFLALLGTVIPQIAAGGRE